MVLRAAAVAFGFTVGLMPIVRWRVRERLVDHPNERSSHEAPTPRGGGVAPAFGAIAAAALIVRPLDAFTSAVLVGSAALALLGLVDDIRSLPARLRLGAQVALAAGLLPWLLADLSGGGLWRFTFAAGSMLWIVYYVNAFNFMDGINGISAIQAIVAGSAWMVLGAHHDADAFTAMAAIITASALGFIPFNFPRGAIFLGDVGSYFFGGWLAITGAVGVRSGIPVEAVIAPLSLYLTDTAVTLMRRLRRREDVWRAHRDHVYQRLVRSGWSHTRTSLVVGAFIATLSILGAAAELDSTVTRAAADASLLAVLLAYAALPNAVVARQVEAGSA